VSIISLQKPSLEKAESELMQCEELESRFLQVYWTVLPFIFFLHPSLTEDQFSTQKALQTVVAGQQAENLLYVDYDAISIESPS